MSNLLRSLLPLFLILLVTPAACTSRKEEGASVPQKGARQQLVTATISDPKTFNLIVSNETSSSTVVGDLFESLVRLNPRDLTTEGMLAESWERSGDGRIWTFHLREGVKWHDGRPFGADDVLFTFRVLYNPGVANSLRDIVSMDGKPFIIEKTDDRTVRITLPRPFAPFLSALMAVPILPAHVLEKALSEGRFADTWGVDTPPEQLIGTGPFLLTRYVPAQFAKYKRNPNYWMKDDQGAPLPYLEEKTLLIVQNQDTTYAKFTAGETDIHPPRPEEVATLKGEADRLGIEVKEIGLDTGSVFVTFNRNPRNFEKEGKSDPKLRWFTDKAFLRAIAHAVDKGSIIANTMHGLGRPAKSEISEENKTFHNPRIPDYDYDLTKAAKLLEEGGYRKGEDGRLRDRDGIPVEFDLHTNAGNRLREQICAILKEDWEKLGMKVNYRPLDFNALVEKLMSNFQWDAILIGLTGGHEPHNGANVHRSSGNLHFWNPRQPAPATKWEAEIDRLVEAGAAEMDLEKRRKIYFRLQEIYHEELPMILTARQIDHVAYKRKILNFEPRIFGTYKPERIRIAD